MRDRVFRAAAKGGLRFANNLLSLGGLEIRVADRGGRYLPELRHTLRLDSRHHSMLDSQLRKTTTWSCGDRDAAAAALTSGELGRIWKELPGGHKWLNYFPIYEELFTPFRHTAPKVLEIG